MAMPISFKQIIEWYQENPSREMLFLIKEKLISFLNDVYFKKYKSRYAEIIRLSNKLTKEFYPNQELQNVAILELITKTFELIIKNQ